MITLRLGQPDEFDLPGDTKLILVWMKAGYLLFGRKACGRLEVWSNAPSPKAIALNPADAARLLARDLIEEDADRSTDSASVYRLTAAGRECAR